tara:strand:+ start:5689 stop:5991 length:303 start_codon:yes stop_codon:yes gene_type:complete
MEDLAALTLDQINELSTDAGFPQEILTCSFNEVNASDEYQYNISYFSPIREEVVINHAFVDLDLQGDVRLSMAEISLGDLNLRETDEQIAARTTDNNEDR